MDEKKPSTGTDEHYEETTNPHNPPESMLDDHARKDWLLSSVGMLAVIFLVTAAAFGWVFVRHQLGKESQLYPDPQALGTSGEQGARESTSGGFDPEGTFSSTREELKFRGVGGPSHLTGLTGTELTKVAELNNAPIGARVSLTDVTVDRTDGSMLWVRDSDATIVVAVPGDMPTVNAGQHVNIIGTIESTGAGTRIRASRIDVR
jgi:uncharacterized protein YdeI (BOF family)